MGTQTNEQSMRRVMKFLLTFMFVATIKAYHPGYYQPHVVYPQFYQTFPNIRIPKPFMEQQIESRQRNVCKNNIGEIVPCYKNLAEKVDQSRIKPVFKRPVNPLFYSISQDDEENSLVKALPSIEDIEEACQGLKEGPAKDYMEGFRKFADFWDVLKTYDSYGRRFFGQSEEDLIFRKLTGIDEFFDKDFNAEMQNFDSFAADFIEETCANPSAEDAGAKFLQISDKFGDLRLQVPDMKIWRYEKVQNYAETICGYEKSPEVDWSWVGGVKIDYLFQSNQIPSMLDIIQHIQENSKDLKCANRVTKYLNGLIQIMIQANLYFLTSYCHNHHGYCSTRK